MTPSRRAVRRSLRTDFTPSMKLRMRRAAHAALRMRNVPALLTSPTLDRPVFVLGAPRSGTSLLYEILRRSSEFRHWPGESHEIWEADYHPALRGWGSNALDATDVDPRAAVRIKRSFFLVTGRNHRLIDKTPRNSLRVGFVNALFPDARFVFLQRDGRENINSLINAWRTPRYRTYKLPEPHQIPGVDPTWWKFVLYPGWRDDTKGPLERVAARQWITSNDYARGDLESIEPERRIVVRYEDLIDDPVTETGRILGLLEVAYEDAVRAKAADTATTPVNIVTPPERGKWKKENPTEIAAITPLIAPLMKDLGYELE